jgi:hypothetical protein
VSFLWYRTLMTIPAKIVEFDPTSAVIVLTALVDDYAEVWVNGQLPRRPGFRASPRYKASTCQIASCSRDLGKGRRQVRDRDLRDQRTDLSRAAELHLVSRGARRVL